MNFAAPGEPLQSEGSVQSEQPVITFGAYTLHPEQRLLTRGGKPVALRARAMDLLLYLTKHAGTVINKDELLRAIWPNRIVEENNLTVQITQLRKVLGYRPDGLAYVQNVPGRGYVLRGGPDPSAPAFEPAAAQFTLPRPLTRLIGRDEAVRDVRALLVTQRLVTIVGPGGIGKTSLALRVAADVAPDYADGVAFADLSAVVDAARVPEAVAAVLAGGSGANTAAERLTALLRDRHMLLLLDNCEHVVAEVATLAGDLLAACPRIVVLTTSREGLFLTVEQIYRLLPLPVPPDPRDVDAASARTWDSVQLFVERATAAGEFALDDESAPLVAAICAQLDGIPLAIEMAVPRLKVLSLSALADRLDQRFRLLAMPERGASPRHRTLLAVMDWSFNLLTPPEQVLLRMMAVFSGGADLAAIQAIAGTPDNEAWILLDQLGGLVDKSLLMVEPSRRRRFRLLQTVRHYAADKLREDGEQDAFRRHARYFADRFARAADEWRTAQGPDWLHAHGIDADNLRAALIWSFEAGGDPATGVRLAAASVPLWWELPDTPLAEGQRWFAAASAHLDAQTPPALRGWVRFGQSWRDFRFGDRENLPAAQEAVSLFRAAGDSAGLGAALWRAGSALLTRETAGEAETCLTEAEAVLRTLPPGKWLALTLIRLGDLWFRRGEADRALAYYHEGFALSRSTQFWIGLVNGGSNMAELMFASGQAAQALRQLQTLRDEQTLLRRTPLMATLSAHLLLAGQIDAMRQAATEAITQGAAIGLTAALAWTIEAVALLVAGTGDLPTAARLAGYARAVHPSLATRAGSRKEVLERLDAQLSALDAPTRVQALAEGAAWTAREAADRALAALTI
jgi:predicted ATPase/DNA-binding winged helix-turn-helix (wHTH) protein